MGTRMQATKKLSSRAVQIDKNVKIAKIEQKPKGIYKCSCCGKEYPTQKGNFPVSNSVLFAGNDGYITVCRDCVERYYLQMVGVYSGNEAHAIERCCQIFDWYYNDAAVAMTKNASMGYSRISMYPGKANLTQIKQKGTTYVDTLKDRQNAKIMSAEDIKPIPQVSEEDNDTEEAIHSIPEETIRFFGFGYTSDEYEYLEDQYEDWCARYECKTKAQEELFKSLCIAQLTIQKAQKKGTTKDVNDAMRTFQDLLGTANLKPSQTNDNALTEQNTFGTLIKKWENDKPISEPEEEWKDVDGIEKYIDTFFLGHLCNLVHVKNDKEASYRAEMEKYTVKPPVYEEDDLGETSLLDKFSDKDKGDADGNLPQ
jgi:hypothetical protein